MSTSAPEVRAPERPTDDGVTLGIDVGGTKMLGLAVCGGDVLAEVLVPTPGHAGADPDPRASDLLVEALGSVADGLLTELGPEAGVSAVGVGVPGLVDSAGVLRYAPNLAGGNGVAIGRRLSARLGGLPTMVDNDATCATLCEWEFGAAAGAHDAVMVTLGTGIGGGIIAGGRVVRGESGFAGELGHMVVDPAGPPCPCGKRGCWERYASGSGLARMAREAAHAGRLDGLVALAGGNPDAVRREDVTTAAGAGDAGARAVLEELGWWLALGLSNMALALDSSVMVVGGGLVEAIGLVLERVRVVFDELLEGRAYRPGVEIVPAALGERAGAIGAALVARQGGRDRTGTGGASRA